MEDSSFLFKYLASTMGILVSVFVGLVLIFFQP